MTVDPAPLRGNRHFRALLVARAVSALGSTMTPIALAFAVLDRSGLEGMRNLALVIAAGQVAQTVTMLFGGVLADRVPRGRLMSRTEVGAGAVQALVATMVWQDALVWPLLGLLFVLKGAANALFLPASAGVVPTIVAGGDLTAANATLRLALNLVRICGAGVATAVTLTVGPHVVLWADSASFVVAGLVLHSLHWPDPRVPRAPSTFVTDLRRGWTEFSSRRWVVVAVAQMTVVNASVSAFVAVLGPSVSAGSSYGMSGWALLVTVQTIGLVVGSAVAFRARSRRPIRFLVVVAGVEAVPLLLVAAHAPLWAAAAGMLVTAVVMDVYSVLWDSTLQREIPEEALSRVASYDMLASFSGAPLGLVLVGLALGSAGPGSILTVLGVAVLVTVPLGLASRGVRTFRASGSGPRASVAA